MLFLGIVFGIFKCWKIIYLLSLFLFDSCSIECVYVKFLSFSLWHVWVTAIEVKTEVTFWEKQADYFFCLSFCFRFNKG